LALMIKDDYAKVGIPMMPVIVGESATARQIWIYTILLMPTTISLMSLGSAGLVYGISALGLGGIFVYKAWQLLQAPANKKLAKSMFKYSILYMMLLCTAIVVDSLPQVHSAIGAISNLN
jgi:heme o synthase